MKDHSPAAVLDNLAALGTAAAEVDIPAAEGVLGKHPAAAHTVSFLLRSNVVRNPHKAYRSLVQDTTVADNRNHYDHQGNIAGSCLLEDLVHHDCIGPHNSLPGLSTAVVGPVVVVGKEESASGPSYDCLG